MTAPVHGEALELAREVQRLASAVAGLTAALDKGWPTNGDEQTLSTLRAQWSTASHHFDAFVASVSLARRTEWVSHVQAIASALGALEIAASEKRAAAAIAPIWRLAAAGKAPRDFAGGYLEGVLLVDRNYRLLLKSGALPQGFPRVSRGG